jgi:hypothetical protein
LRSVLCFMLRVLEREWFFRDRPKAKWNGGDPTRKKSVKKGASSYRPKQQSAGGA